jgi:hypothetical protein
MLNDVSPSDIEDMTERYLPLFEDSKDSDTVKRINLKGKTPLFIIAILEHESQVNYRASFKMLQYIALVLNEYEKEANKENQNASSAKDFKYPPVLPIVFYDGPGAWTAETNFVSKTELSDIFDKYIPKFEYEHIDLNKYDEQAIAGFGNALSLVMLIDKIQTSGGISILNKLPVDYFDKLKENTPSHLFKLLADVITVFLTRINVPEDEIERVTKSLYERRIHEMFTLIDNYDVQETRREARLEARMEERMVFARRLLKKNRPIDEIIEYTELSREEIEKLREA